jgi:hypothetical protein
MGHSSDFQGLVLKCEYTQENAQNPLVLGFSDPRQFEFGSFILATMLSLSIMQPV